MVSAIDVLNVPAFMAWLKTMPEDETFCYMDGENCAIAQYLKAKGVTFKHVGSATILDEFDTVIIPKAITFPLELQIENPRRTFGSLLECFDRCERASP